MITHPINGSINREQSMSPSSGHEKKGRSYVMITHPQYTKAELSYPRSNGSINREQSMSPSSQKVMKRNTLFPSG